MGSCAKCGQSLTPASLFCPTCGAKVPVPVLAPLLVTPPRASVRGVDGPVDPLASTTPATLSPAAGMAPKPPSSDSARSPKAETGFQVPFAPRDAGSSPAIVAAPPSPEAPAAEAVRRPSRGKTVPLAKDPPPAAPAPGAPLAKGTRVLVQWANGQKYPGAIEQAEGAQCLVRFDAGEQRWVESRFVVPAR